MGKSGFEWEGDGATCHSTLTTLKQYAITPSPGVMRTKANKAFIPFIESVLNFV